MMLLSSILLTSLILQFIAVCFALRLIRVSGKTLAWSLIAAAITLMGLRSGLRLEQVFDADSAKQPNLFVELIALGISALMAIGIERITPIISGVMRQRTQDIRYRTIFENSPVSIWEEDFSDVKTLFDHLRSEGVKNLDSHFDDHPELIRQCTELSRIINVNHATLILHKAANKEVLLAGLANTFTPESFATFREELVCLWRGDTGMTREAIVKTLDGEPRHVTVYFTVCPGYETTLSKVFVSLIDITDRKKAEVKLKQALKFTEGIINAVPDILFEVDMEGRYLNVWTSQPELLAAPREVLLSKKISDILPPEQAAIAIAAIHEADEKGISVGNILRLDLPGGPNWFEHSLSKVTSDDPSAKPRFIGLSRDVTERMLIEEELRASEQRFHAIFDQSFQFIGLLSTEGTLLAANRAALEFAGAELSEVLGRPFWEGPWWTHDSEIQQRLRKAIREAAGGQFVRYEVTHRDREGGLHYIDFSLKPIADSIGRVVQLIPEGRDITERRQVEEERKLHADFLNNMDRINRAIQGTEDLETMMRNVLDAVLDIFGCDRVYLLYPCDPTASSFSVPMERTRPEFPDASVMGNNIPMESTISDTMATLLKTPGTLKFGPGTDYPLPASTSERYGFKSSMSIALFPKTGKPWEFGMHQCSYGRVWTAGEEKLLEEIGTRLSDGLTGLLVLREMRESERRLVEAQNLAHLGNWELDLVDNRLTWSDEIYRIFEVGKERFDSTYAAFLEVVHPDDREMVNGTYTESLNARKPYNIVHRLLMEDGRIKYVNEHCETFYDADGKPLRSVGTVQDITEQKLREDELSRYRDHLEEEVRQRTTELILARDAAEAANKAKSVFLANMSHELRTPLNAILGFSQMMRQEPNLAPAQRANVDIISRSGEHLLKVINDVLEIAKIEAGKLQLEVTTFDLHGLVYEVADMMRLRAQQKGLRLRLDQSSEFPHYIRGDEARLRQILVNLLGNAVKFTSKGGVTIRLGVKNNARQHLLVEVEDTGPGISEENQRHLFKPFVQLAEGVAQGGTGLGLAIVRQFVELMDGGISVESTLGKGSLFRIDLPLEKADTAELDQLAPPHLGDVIGLVPDQPVYRTLIAENHRDSQRLLAKLMTEMGLPVKIAGSGEECVALFESWRPHLIWMDWRMPGMDGVEATRHIRQLAGGDKVRIVAVTASAFKEQQPALLAAGMNDYIRKPFHFGEIYRCLKQQLGLEFIYRTEHKCEDGERLAPSMLAILEEDLRGQLHDAVLTLDSSRIDAVVERIRTVDAPLAKRLSRLTAAFDYPAILDALSAAKK